MIPIVSTRIQHTWHTPGYLRTNPNQIPCVLPGSDPFGVAHLRIELAGGDVEQESIIYRWRCSGLHAGFLVGERGKTKTVTKLVQCHSDQIDAKGAVVFIQAVIPGSAG